MPLPSELIANRSAAETPQDYEATLGMEQLLPHLPLDYVAAALGAPLNDQQYEAILQSDRLCRRISANLCADLDLPTKWEQTPALNMLTCGSKEELNAAITLTGALLFSREIRQTVVATPRYALIALLGESAYDFVLDQDDETHPETVATVTPESLSHAGARGLNAYLNVLAEPLRRALALRLFPDFLAEPAGNDLVFEKAVGHIHAQL